MGCILLVSTASILNSSCHSSPTVLRWFVALILALSRILLHTVEQKTSDVTFERQISNRQKNRNKKKGTYTFLRTTYHGISSTRSLERNGGKDREKRKRERGRKRRDTDKRSHSDENAAAATFPAKGGTQRVCWMADGGASKGFSLHTGAERGRLYVYGINARRRSPAGSQGKHEMTGERKRRRNQRAVCCQAFFWLTLE